MWNGMMQGKSIDQGWMQRGNKALNEVRIHPTQKPIDLYRWIIREYIRPGWKVLDTHVGSASSLIAYGEAGIEYVGFEKGEKIYEKAKRRLKKEMAQMSIFDLGVERI
jgi:site-specific DNA-methyltransferase (adenine-specific)